MLAPPAPHAQNRCNRGLDLWRHLTLKALLQTEAGLAQLVEHLICNQGVTSSNLVAGTIYGTNRDRRSRLVQRTLAKHFARIHDALRIKRVLDR
jgi:hypothetical protein